jgi:hypothetical protein
MRFLTWADSEANTAVGCDGEEGDDGGDDDDDEELKGLKPPKDILRLLVFSPRGRRSDGKRSELPVFSGTFSEFMVHWE